MRQFSTKNVLGIKIADVTLENIVFVIEKLIKTPGKKTFFGIHVHAANVFQRDPEFREAIKNASLLYPEGAGIVLASKVTGSSLKGKTTLMDFIYDIFKIADKNNWSVFVLGGKDAVVKKAKSNLEKKFPNLKISVHNGFLNGKEKEIIGKINIVKPKILFVAMGTPQQEVWIYKNMKSINASAFFGIGGSVDVIAGRVLRAPKIMHRTGFEWLYRLYKEPKRLWRRYIFGNSVFLGRVLMEVLYNVVHEK